MPSKRSLQRRRRGGLINHAMLEWERSMSEAYRRSVDHVMRELRRARLRREKPKQRGRFGR